VNPRLKAAGAWLLDSVRTVREVPIDHCSHYRGYRYGGYGDNPYEDYVIGLARNDSVDALRQHFAWLVLHCRARTMAEALHVDLPPDWPLWAYPWARGRVPAGTPSMSAAANPDVMCHFSPEGVLASHVNREFAWLESAWHSIKVSGYLPGQYGYIRCMELSRGEESRYIVVDGNHRISALHATGRTTVAVQVLRLRQVRREDAAKWRRVRDGSIDLESALRIFDRYFATRNPAPVMRHPATLIRDEAPLWQDEETSR
jgi:hypothetical protein